MKITSEGRTILRQGKHLPHGGLHLKAFFTARHHRVALHLPQHPSAQPHSAMPHKLAQYILAMEPSPTRDLLRRLKSASQ